MNLNEALKKLGIEEYSERISNSNSHGELFHILDYIEMAKIPFLCEDNVFAGWFEETVNAAENQWERPESVFQHIPELLKQAMKFH